MVLDWWGCDVLIYLHLTWPIRANCKNFKSMSLGTYVCSPTSLDTRAHSAIPLVMVFKFVFVGIFSVNACFVDEILLTRSPMLMVHDSATGYMKDLNIFQDQVVKWADTQGVNLTGQLDCGARFLDARPKLDSEKLVFHHGDVKIGHLFSDSLNEVKDWLRTNRDELVVMLISHYDGDGCKDAVKCFEIGKHLQY